MVADLDAVMETIPEELEEINPHKIVKDNTKKPEVMSIHGDAPDWSTTTIQDPDYNERYISALNWANASLSHDFLKQETIQYLRNEGKDAEIYETLKNTDFFIVGKYCWLSNNSCPFTEYGKTFFEKKLDQLEEVAIKAQKEKSNIVPKATKKEINERKYAHIFDTVIGIFDDLIYDYVSGEEIRSDTIYNYFLNENISKKIAKDIKSHYQKQIKLYNKEQDVLKATDEPEIWFDSLENYENYCADIEKSIEIIDSIINQTKSYTSNKTIGKKSTYEIRVGSNKTSKLNYCQRSADYNITSVPALLIIGAECLVVFNTKNRKLGLYVASDEKGLQVKGSTILNYNNDKSSQKTLRKPEEHLVNFQKSTLKRINRLYGDYINSKPLKLTGRINKHTILLKIFK